MDPDPVAHAPGSTLVRRATFGLMALSSAAIEIAAVDSRPVAASLGEAAVGVALAAALAWLAHALFPRAFPANPEAARAAPPRAVLVVLLALAALPFLVEPWRREWAGDGYPLELQMVFALRNLGLGLAAFSSWLLCLRLACVVSLFLMLFAVSVTDHPAALTALGLYAAAGSTWLMLAHWAGLRRGENALVGDSRLNESVPWLAGLGVVAVVGAALGMVAVGPARAAWVLGEWLPTSGGTGGYDAFARGGVNDGDDEVKGNNAKSTGMTQTDQFLDSPLPSLYDLFNDTYGEPLPPKEQERSIALDPQTKAGESTKPPADNLRPNREFPTTRRSPRQTRDPSGRSARALFEVQGHTPLHVRVVAFDRFDGRSWHEGPRVGNSCRLEKEPDSCWMKVEERTPPAVFARPESHQFKITGSIGSLVPVPPHLMRFRVGRVDRADFFGWAQDRILRLAERNTPSGIIVETECRTVDPRLLDGIEFPTGGIADRVRYAELPAHLDPGVTALARRWGAEHSRGWRQIAAILDRLQTEYTLDPTARVPEDCRDPLAYFLLHSRRGPDYQFATAACVLLRILDYPTRLVSGFYAAPEHFDPVTRHTPVGPDDLHFWTEVMLPCGDWLVVEATPGYAVLGPNLPLSERLWAALLAAAGWAGRHAGVLGPGLAALAGLWWWRRRLLDVGTLTLWRWFPGPTWQQCVRRALWLLERRARWAGRPRPASQTVQAWLRSIVPDHDLAHLARMAEWAAYAPDLAPPWQGAEVREVCGRVLDVWSCKHWRLAAVVKGA